MVTLEQQSPIDLQTYFLISVCRWFAYLCVCMRKNWDSRPFHCFTCASVSICNGHTPRKLTQASNRIYHCEFVYERNELQMVCRQPSFLELIHFLFHAHVIPHQDAPWIEFRCDMPNVKCHTLSSLCAPVTLGTTEPVAVFRFQVQLPLQRFVIYFFIFCEQIEINTWIFANKRLLPYT